jgi:hypothetical protein
MPPASTSSRMLNMVGRRWDAKSKIRERCWRVKESAIMDKAFGRASVMAAKARSKSCISCTPRGCTVRPNARAATSIWVKLGMHTLTFAHRSLSSMAGCK